MDLDTFDPKATSAILIRLRTERGWTQAVAAEHCEVSRWTYMQIENGYTEHPRTITLDKIAKGFGVSYASLLGQPNSADKIVEWIVQAIDYLEKVKSALC